MDDIILKRMPGFPTPNIFRNKYKKINIDEIDDIFIGKNVIIIAKYKKQLYGNFHEEFLYIGVIINPLINVIDYEKYIYIKDIRLSKNISLRKSRLSNKNPSIELYVSL
jgi:hypothetical protein